MKQKTIFKFIRDFFYFAARQKSMRR